MTTHYLKTVEPYYSDVKKGLKRFEVREKYKDFKVGDLIFLLKYHPFSSVANIPEHIKGEITYILDNEEYCKKGFVILGFKVI